MGSSTVTVSFPTHLPIPALLPGERYAMRCVERETFYGRESLDAWDESVVDAWYDLAWGSA